MTRLMQIDTCYDDRLHYIIQTALAKNNKITKYDEKYNHLFIKVKIISQCRCLPFVYVSLVHLILLYFVNTKRENYNFPSCCLILHWCQIRNKGILWFMH
jgi:hypothetical protein